MSEDQEMEIDVISPVSVNKHLTIDHIIGQPLAKEELALFIKRVKHVDVFRHWGLDTPKAIALTGPPGVGKTHSVRCLANELDCALLELRYEDIASRLYDDSIEKLSKIKKQIAKYSEKYGHVIIFLDEADSFFQSRFDTNAHSSDKKKTNFFLQWIDGGIESSSGFTFIAASNAWDAVDPAIKRSGRFSEIKYKELSSEDVKEAFKVHVELAELSASRKLFSEIDYDELPYLDEISGADVKSIVDSLCLDKANFYIENNDTYDESIASSFLIDTSDFIKQINKFKSKDSNKKKRLGFGKY